MAALIVPLAHGPIGPLDELAPLALSMAVLAAWWLKYAVAHVHARWEDRHRSPLE